MKLSTFNNRTKSVTKNSSGYQLAKQLLTTGKPVSTCWTSGTGRFCKNMYYTDATINVLKLAGLKENKDFRFYNTSPRGGKTGDTIALTTTGKTKLIR